MRFNKILFKTILSAFIGALVAVILFRYVFLIANVVSGSMEPTVMTGADTLANRLSYKFDTPKRGDVAFFYPVDEPGRVFLKRVIGLPGEHVEVKDGSVYIDGDKLKEPYLTETMDGLFDGEWDVPKDKYFMMGDNRNNSDDSRLWRHPFVDRNRFIAKAFLGYDKEHGLQNIK